MWTSEVEALERNAELFEGCETEVQTDRAALTDLLSVAVPAGHAAALVAHAPSNGRLGVAYAVSPASLRPLEQERRKMNSL